MKRKKVAILLPWLKMGGTNKIAVNFMHELSQYCDVTLILSQYSGELLPELDRNINIVVDRMKDFKTIVKEDLRHLRMRNLFRDFLYYAKIKMGKDSIDNYKYIVDRNSFVCDTKFDCAISYHGQSPERLLNLIYRIHADKRVAWIHGEISFSEETCIILKKYYDKIDHFFFVSKPTMDVFQKRIGFDAAKGTVYYNPIDKKDILDRSCEDLDIVMNPKQANLLTVGRISEEKGQDMIPQITRKLLDCGINTCWYVIGDGDNRKVVERLIDECGVSEHVKLLGIKMNPYCYMKACDIYIQPSYTEGYSTTICEAGILGKAIIGTKPSGGIRDQITDGEDGLIVDATVEAISSAVQMLLNDNYMRKKFEVEIQKKNFEGKGEIRKFLDYLFDESYDWSI